MCAPFRCNGASWAFAVRMLLLCAFLHNGAVLLYDITSVTATKDIAALGDAVARTITLMTCMSIVYRVFQAHFFYYKHAFAWLSVYK